MDPEANLYDAFAAYGSGVCLVTVRNGDDDSFFVAASVLTASVDPFALAVSVGVRRPALAAISEGRPWTVSVLAADHLDLVRRLTTKTTHEERLAALRAAGVERSPDRTLRLPDALATFSCVTASMTPVNDQVLVVGSVVGGALGDGRAPLLRWDHGFHGVADITERKLSA
ncbi:flavin reductase [Gordonia sp. PDNC005]|uniref:flavin reductase n=1 Tax=unclassified Gordonia (in: high G+C Gram-positive bacteria) TaxID=2657482 RepID=UPI0019648D59|nr:flavin reductase [Gordonia sp. PDNC005]QRY64231.1 flavin reductase [Gordonia sp. PDNC005]